jgi:predicted nucleic acid-binding protein
VIAYVESNFVLEMARQQEEAVHAENLIRLAETNQISLIVPTIAICEPFSTLTYYGLERKRLVDIMEREFRELGRLGPHKSLVAMLQPLGQTLLSIDRGEMQSLEIAVERVLNVVTAVPLTASVFVTAREKSRSLGLSLQDAIVYASVLDDLRNRDPHEEKCFLSRNSRDFADPSIGAELQKHNCRYIARFGDRVLFINSRLRQP